MKIVKLIEELLIVSKTLCSQMDDKQCSMIRKIRNELIQLARKKLIKSNHTIMELIIAAFLIKKGYDISVEKVLEKDLICDIFAEKDGKRLIVEVETGFVPPSNSLDPILYRVTREISKVVRYSGYAEYFALATLPYHILQLPEFLFFPPAMRSPSLIAKTKALLDKYYKNPPIPVEKIKNAKLDYVYITIVDEYKVIEYTAKEYYSKFISSIRINFEKELRNTSLALLYTNSFSGP